MRKWFIGLAVVAAIGYLCVIFYTRANSGTIPMTKNVLLVVASKGFQHHEFQATRSALEKAGYTVTVTSDKVGTAVADNGFQIEATADIEKVSPKLYDAVYVIGGPGTLDCLDNPTMYEALNRFLLAYKPYGAICLGPRVLANAQMLHNKKATGWNGDGKLEEVFDDNQVIYVDEPVVVYDKVITANGPKAADDFGKAIVTMLASIQS